MAWYNEESSQQAARIENRTERERKKNISPARSIFFLKASNNHVTFPVGSPIHDAQWLPPWPSSSRARWCTCMSTNAHKTQSQVVHIITPHLAHPSLSCPCVCVCSRLLNGSSCSSWTFAPATWPDIGSALRVICQFVNFRCPDLGNIKSERRNKGWELVICVFFWNHFATYSLVDCSYYDRQPHHQRFCIIFIVIELVAIKFWQNSNCFNHCCYSRNAAAKKEEGEEKDDDNGGGGGERCEWELQGVF